MSTVEISLPHLSKSMGLACACSDGSQLTTAHLHVAVDNIQLVCHLISSGQKRSTQRQARRRLKLRLVREQRLR